MHLKMLNNLIFEDFVKKAEPTTFLAVITIIENLEKHKF